MKIKDTLIVLFIVGAMSLVALSLIHIFPDPVADYEDRLADYMVRMDSRLEELEEIIKKHREQNEKRGNNE